MLIKNENRIYATPAVKGLNEDWKDLTKSVSFIHLISQPRFDLSRDTPANRQHWSIFGLPFKSLSTTIVVFIRFISRLNYCYWERNVSLDINICKYLVSNQTNMSNFLLLQFMGRGSETKLQVGKKINDFISALTLSARGPSLDVRFWRLKSISSPTE